MLREQVDLDLVIRKEEPLGVKFEFKEVNKSPFLALDAHSFFCFRVINKKQATFKDKSGKVYGIKITDKKQLDLSELQSLGLDYDPYKVIETLFN